MIDFILAWLLSVLSISLGWYIGKTDRLPNPIQFEKPVNVFPFSISSTNKKLGAFEEPTQQDIILNNNPEMKAEYEQVKKVFKDAQPNNN